MLFDINIETERARCLLSFEMRSGRWTLVFAICGVSDFYTVGVFQSRLQFFFVFMLCWTLQFFFSIFVDDSFRSYIRRLCGISTVQIQKTTTLRSFSLTSAALVSPYLININLTTCYDRYQTIWTLFVSDRFDNKVIIVVFRWYSIICVRCNHLMVIFNKTDNRI